MTALIEKLWDVSWDMWQHRNNIKHNILHFRATIELDYLHWDIRDQLQLGKRGLQEQDLYLFSKDSTKNLEKQEEEYKRSWLEAVVLARAAAEAYNDNRDRRLRQSQELMWNWISQATPATQQPRAALADNTQTIDNQENP